MTEQPTLTDGIVTLRPLPDSAEGALLRFGIEYDGSRVGGCAVRRTDAETGELSWELNAADRGHGHAARAVQVLTDYALSETGQGGLGLTRVEARVELGNEPALRVATRSGLRREGVRRVAPGPDHVVLARLADDPPLSEAGSFRSLLNSFLPRKRAISQLAIRDEAGRILLCQLTYKQDWDLPGGVVEVGESPQTAVAREVEEELGLEIAVGALLLTDWLPPWGGWDDALCLVFDGGAHPASITDRIVKQAREIRSAEFCDAEQVRERCADFTARRIEAALRGLTGEQPAYTESGR